MCTKSITDHINNHRRTMVPAIALLSLTALAAVVLAALSTRTSMQGWMSHKVLGHARWKWLVGGAIAASATSLVLAGCSFRKDKSEPQRTLATVQGNINLPEGWTKALGDVKSGQIIYHHSSGRQQSEHPNLFNGWQALLDVTTCTIYYYHPQTGQTSWDYPADAAKSSSPLRSTTPVLPRDDLPKGWSDEEASRLGIRLVIRG